MDGNSEADRRKRRVEKYFCETPDPKERTRAILLVSASALGGLLAVIMFAQGGTFLGVLLLAAGGFGGYKGLQQKADYDRRYAAAEPKPRDEEMDELLDGDLNRVCKHAVQRLGLTLDELELFPQGDPLANLDRRNPLVDQQWKRPWVVCGPEYRGFSFGPKVRAFSTVGSDGICRFAAYDVMVICPTGYHLALYKCTIDFLTGLLRQEQTQEYHYADVVSVSTATRSDQKVSFHPLNLRGGKRIHFEKALFRDFEIVVSSGDRSNIVVGIQDEERPEMQAELQPSGIEEVISSVRRMLKEKKGGVVGPAGQIKGLPPGAGA